MRAAAAGVRGARAGLGTQAPAPRVASQRVASPGCGRESRPRRTRTGAPAPRVASQRVASPGQGCGREGRPRRRGAGARAGLGARAQARPRRAWRRSAWRRSAWRRCSPVPRRSGAAVSRTSLCGTLVQCANWEADSTLPRQRGVARGLRRERCVGANRGLNFAVWRRGRDADRVA